MRITRRTKPRYEPDAGLTLIELLVVILILGMLATMVTTNVFNIFGQSRIKTAESEIQTIKSAIGQFKLLEGHLPQELLELTSGDENYLSNVSKGQVPVDPWDRPYVYTIDPGIEGGFLLWSLGEEEDDDSDDIRSDRIGKQAE